MRIMRMTVLLMVACCAVACGAKSREPIRMLAWVGYEEQDYLSRLQEVVGFPVNVKTYVGGDQMYNMYSAASAGTYDIVVVDVEYGRKLFSEKKIQLIDSVEVAPSSYHPFFHKVASANATDGGGTFAVVSRWGALGVVYNSDKVEAREVESYSVLWKEKYRGRVGLFDWYLPNMGVLSKAIGNADAYGLDSDAFSRLSEKTLSLSPQVTAINPNTSEVIADLGSGKVWLVPGIGEWACASLMVQGKPLNWSIPKEGGIMWVEALALSSTVTGARREQALRVIRAMASPELQASLAWRGAYQSQVPNIEAYGLMTEEQRKVLRISSKSDMSELISHLSVRELPKRQTEQEWQKAWDQLKSIAIRN